NYWPEGKQEESGDQSQSDNSSSDPNKQSKGAKARSILSRSLKSPTKKKNVILLSKTARCTGKVAKVGTAKKTAWV
ncbi:hypothetical protein, partial [Gilliamella sp. Lep-s21]